MLRAVYVTSNWILELPKSFFAFASCSRSNFSFWAGSGLPSVCFLVVDHIDLDLDRAVWILGTGLRNFKSIRVHETQRVIQCVCVSVPGLGIGGSGTCHHRVNRRKPPLRSRAVPCPDVIQSRLGVPVLAGELVNGSRVLACIVVHTG